MFWGAGACAVVACFVLLLLFYFVSFLHIYIVGFLLWFVVVIALKSLMLLLIVVLACCRLSLYFAVYVIVLFCIGFTVLSVFCGFIVALFPFNLVFLPLVNID